MLMPSAPGTRHYETIYATLDHSNTSEGYIVVGCVCKCVIQLENDNRTQKFTVLENTMKTLPLCLGDGDYIVRVLKHIEGTRYRAAASWRVPVKLRSPQAPYLYPNTYCEYTPESKCVQKATELCKSLKTDVQRIGAIYEWICTGVEYDKELAASVKAGDTGWWLPEPDAVIAKGKGVCWDYSALFAAMCRSQGIACKIEVGGVGDNRLLHAWNNIWSRDGGTVAGIPISEKAYTRMDVTLLDSSNGAAAAFVRDGSNYAVQYCG